MAARGITGPNGPPTVWVHCGTENALGAMKEIAARMAQIGDAPVFFFTVSADLGIIEDAAKQIDSGNSYTLQSILTDQAPALLLWVAAPLKLVPLNICQRAGVATALVHVPERPTQARPWLWRKTVLPGALRQINRIFTTPVSTTAWRGLGARPTRVQTCSSLEEGIVAPPCNEAERIAMSNILAARPVWFLNNLPLDELSWVVQAIQTVQRSWPRLVTILDPANVADVPTFKDALINEGIIVHDRAIEGEPDAVTQVFLTDGDEEVGLWYRLSALTYLGGTLSGKPVRNPLEAASLGSAIVHGPRVTAHRSAFDRLAAANATTRISHGRQMGDTVSLQLAPDACAERANAAWGVMSEGAEMADILAAYIAEQLNLDMAV
ncbi:MAG: 3-deoxy-D-manno-octulosonic acid transferase [Planktomarina sp.]